MLSLPVPLGYRCAHRLKATQGLGLHLDRTEDHISDEAAAL